MPVWEEIEPHIPSVYRYLLRLTGNAHRAEDLTQEAFLQAWKKRRQLRSDSSARVWMLRIATNLLRDDERRRRRRPNEVAGVEAMADPSVAIPESEAMAVEDRERILTFIDGLPPRQREVIHLSAVEGLSPGEIAEVLDISRNSAKVSLCEARKKLREALFPIEIPKSTRPTNES